MSETPPPPSSTPNTKRWPLWVLPALFLLMAAGSWVRGWPWLVFVGASLLGTGLVCWLACRGISFGWRQVLLVALIGRALMFTIPPGLSEDAFRYLWDGFVQTEGINPFHWRPIDPELAKYRGDPLIVADEHRRFYLPEHRQEHYRPDGGMNCAKQYSVYPPVAQLLLQAAGEAYARQGFWPSYYLLKLLFGLCELSALLILLRLAGVTPATLLYAWNPLVMTETWGQPHSESLALPLVAISVAAMRRNSPVLATATMTLAGWAKLYPLLFLPLLVSRHLGWRKVALMVAVSWAISMVLWWPYWSARVLPNIQNALHLYVHHYEYNGGLYYVLKSVFGLVAGSILRYVFLAITVLLCWRRFQKDHPWEPYAMAIMTVAIITATTIHPWYFLLPLLLMAFFNKQPVWFIVGFGALCVPTYLFYIYPWTYWPAVWLCWLIWPALAFHQFGDSWLQRLLRWRARLKVRLMERKLGIAFPHGSSVLDLGAGEGYVGEFLQSTRGAKVSLVDISNYNRTQLPYSVCDSGQLPFDDNSWEIVVLSFSLHHAENPELLLKEALRVSSEQVVVLESSYVSPFGLIVLRICDFLANSLRHLHHPCRNRISPVFRTRLGWLDLIAACGGQVRSECCGWELSHVTAGFVVRKP